MFHVLECKCSGISFQVFFPNQRVVTTHFVDVFSNAAESFSNELSTQDAVVSDARLDVSSAVSSGLQVLTLGAHFSVPTNDALEPGGSVFCPGGDVLFVVFYVLCSSLVICMSIMLTFLFMPRASLS